MFRFTFPSGALAAAALVPAPAGAAPAATYAAAAVKASQNPARARAFVDSITPAAGTAYLKARGPEG